MVQRTKLARVAVIDRTVMNTTENVMFNVTSAEMIFFTHKTKPRKIAGNRTLHKQKTHNSSKNYNKITRNII